MSFISSAQGTNKPNFSNNNQNSNDQKTIFNFDSKTNVASMFNNNNGKPAETNNEQKQQSAGFFAGSQPVFSNNNNIFAKKDESSLANKANTGLSIFNNTQSTNTGIFGNAEKKDNSPQKVNTPFANVEKKDSSPQKPVVEAKPKTGGLFGNTESQPKTGGLFGNSSGGLFANKTDSQSGGLFGNLPAPSSNIFADGNQITGSIFGTKLPQNEKVEEPKKEEKGSGLFANLTQGATKDSLFSGLSDLNKNNQTPQSMLFGGNISNSFLKTPEDNNGEQNDDDDEVEDDQNEQAEVIDKSKSTGNYKYDELTETLHDMDVANFKVNDSQAYGKGKITIEKIKASGQHMVIFRNPAQLIIFQGLLLKKLSSSDFMKGKNDAIFLISYAMEKQGEEADSKVVPVRKNCKMAFNSTNDAKTLTNFMQENFKA